MDVIGKVEIELSIVGVGTSSSRRLDLPAGSDIRGAEWSPTGEWIATRDIKADSSGGTLLFRPSDGAARRLPGLSSTALAWSKDGKTLYGIAATDTSSEVRALDIASGTIRTIATYSTRLRVEDTIGGTVRLWLDPAGRSFVTTILTDRSNVWLLKGLQDVIGRK